MSYFLSLYDFIEYDFLFYALLTTLCLAPLFGLLSPFILARRFSFMSSAVSHASILGPTLSILVLGIENSYLVYISSLLITLITIIPLAYQSWHKKKIPNDSLIGVYFTSTMALAILISSHYPNEKGNLLSFLFGNLVLMGRPDFLITLSSSILISTLILVNFKKWILITYDPEGSRVMRLPVKKYHYIFFIVITFMIITSIKIAGTILITSLFVIPGLAGLMMAKNKDIKWVFISSVLFSLFSSLLGLVLSNAINTTPGPTMAMTQFLGLLLIKIFIKS